MSDKVDNRPHDLLGWCLATFPLCMSTQREMRSGSAHLNCNHQAKPINVEYDQILHACTAMQDGYQHVRNISGVLRSSYPAGACQIASCQQGHSSPSTARRQVGWNLSRFISDKTGYLGYYKQGGILLFKERRTILMQDLLVHPLFF